MIKVEEFIDLQGLIFVNEVKVGECVFNKKWNAYFIYEGGVKEEVKSHGFDFYRTREFYWMDNVLK